MTLRLTEAQDRQLTAIAQSLNISKNKVAVDAIQAFIEIEWQRAIARNVVSEVLIRDKELLDRLADS